jgi:hypothetical protein
MEISQMEALNDYALIFKTLTHIDSDLKILKQYSKLKGRIISVSSEQSLVNEVEVIIDLLNIELF